MNKHAQLLVFASLAAAFVFAGYVGAQQANRAKPAAVGVVDVKKVFDALQEKTQIEADMATKRQQLATESNKRKAEIEQLKADLEGILRPGTSAYEEKKDEYEQKSIQFQAWVSYQNRKLSQMSVVQTEGLYKSMLDTIATVSRANGYDVVLFKERDVKFRGAKPEQMAAAIQVRKVLYASDALDISELVVQKMNNDFKNKPKN